MRRLDQGIVRSDTIRVEIDGESVEAFTGETAAIALLSNQLRFRDDRSGAARGMFCNMGTCSECSVWIARANSPWQRHRACLIPVEAGLRIATRTPQGKGGA